MDPETVFSRGMWVDSGSSLYDKAYNPSFLTPLEKDLRLTRWSHYGSEAGFSRYSAFWIAYDNPEGWNDNGRIHGGLDYLFDHHDSMYLKLFLMVTFYRASLMKLSEDLSRLDPGHGKSSRANRDLLDHIKRTHKDVITFTNKHWFSELTNQDQGIEIYDMMRRAFRLDELFNELKADLQRTDAFVDSVRSAEEQKYQRRISTVGIPLAGGALVTGFFGMNVFGDRLGRLGPVAVILGAFFAAHIYSKWNSLKNEEASDIGRSDD